jgi:hypothetical protein
MSETLNDKENKMTAIVVDEVTKEWVVTELQMTEEDLIHLYSELASESSD